MSRSMITKVMVKKTVRFVASTLSDKDVVNVFIDTERSTKCIGWVTENKHDLSLDPEVVEAARKFLKEREWPHFKVF